MEAHWSIQGGEKERGRQEEEERKIPVKVKGQTQFSDHRGSGPQRRFFMGGAWSQLLVAAGRLRLSRRTWSLCSPTSPAPTSDREPGAEAGMLLKQLLMLASRWTYRRQSRRIISNHAENQHSNRRGRGRSSPGCEGAWSECAGPSLRPSSSLADLESKPEAESEVGKTMRTLRFRRFLRPGLRPALRSSGGGPEGLQSGWSWSWSCSGWPRRRPVH